MPEQPPKRLTKTRLAGLGIGDDNSPIIIGDSGTAIPPVGAPVIPLAVPLPAAFLLLRHNTFHFKHDVSVANTNFKVTTVSNSVTIISVASPPWILSLNGGVVTLFSIDNITVSIATNGNDYDTVVRDTTATNPKTDLIIGTANLNSAKLTVGGVTTELFNGTSIQVNFVHI
jgi:hypothetical protein